MNPAATSPLSRREWLERVSGPAAMGSLGTAAFVSSAVAASGSSAPTSTGQPTLLGARTYNVRDFGAKGDGATIDTKAVQAAFDACHAESGGVVLVPAGDFVVGTLQLKSNITLHL